MVEYFKQDGTIELVSSYQAFTEAAFTSNNHSDLLFPAMNAAERKKLERKRKKLIDRMQKRKKTPVNAETRRASEASYDPTALEKFYTDTNAAGGNFESSFHKLIFLME